MNKKIIITMSSLAIIAGIFLAGNVGLKFFFHDYLYETPNLKGLKIEEARTLVGSNFKLVHMGEHYSEFKKGEIYSQLPISQKHIKKGRPIKVWISKGIDTVILPDLKGKNMQDARVILSDLGIKVGRISHTMEGYMNNKVIGTDPSEGSSISRGSSVSLLINVSKIKNIRMPDILGFSQGEGEKILREKKLVIGDIKRVHRNDFPEDTIIDVSYPAGKDVLAGSIINITVTAQSEEE
ncbi:MULTISPECIES: PASTA domain-containing protein [Psychrilyobacter]|nr:MULTISPECIES: PASTA domain-containing protein [Psychrilyobacter]MCS5421273.1 PASTA domain-containing protein [Psychrilyobacter sp. S5]NDI78136.1 PASTA domain-containing protein [Psychrilyobacter piezotolerans]